MTLGHAGHPEWRDMSDYLVHFVGGLVTPPEAEDDEQRFGRLVKILGERRLCAGDKGFGLGYSWKMPTHSARCVCLSEIPLDMLERLTDRRGRFGVAVHREFVRQSGGNRVWYLDEGSDPHTWLSSTVQWVADNRWWEHDLWRVVRFIDPVINDGERRHEWYWEREWRVPERLDLGAGQVAFVFAPAEYHARLRSTFGETRLIDPCWPMPILIAALP